MSRTSLKALKDVQLEQFKAFMAKLNKIETFLKRLNLKLTKIK